jgi:hypothetical protein
MRMYGIPMSLSKAELTAVSIRYKQGVGRKILVMVNLWYRDSGVLSDVFEGSGLAG